MRQLKEAGEESVEEQIVSKISASRIRSTAERLSRNYMRVPGSEAERKTGEEIAAELEKLGLSTRAEEFDTASWEYGPAKLSLSGGSTKEIEVHFMPFSPPAPKGGAKGKLAMLKFGFPKEYASLADEPIILLIDWNQPAGVHMQMLAAARSGKDIRALGLIAEDEGAFRIDAVPMLEKPIPFPVFTVKREDGLMLRMLCEKERPAAHFDGMSRIIERAKGRNIIALRKGEEDTKVVVSAHHDGWFEGANDNLSSVACMLEVARLTSDLDAKRGAEFISFSCEEGGARGYQYYLWGSRQHVRMNDGDMRSVACVLNSELAGNSNSEHLLVDCTPDMVSFFETAFDDVRSGKFARKLKVEFGAAVPTSSQADQLSFSLKGVPSSLIYWAWYDEYHTDLDRAATLSEERLQVFADLLVRSSVRMLSSEILPLSLTRYARILRAGHTVVSSHLSSELHRYSTPGIDQLKRLYGSQLDFAEIAAALETFSRAAASFERSLAPAEGDAAKAKNRAMLDACGVLNREMCRIGGVLGEDAVFPGYLLYADDLRKIDTAVEALLKVSGSDISESIKRELVPMVETEVSPLDFDIGQELENLTRKRERLNKTLQKELGRLSSALIRAADPLSRGS